MVTNFGLRNSMKCALGVSPPDAQEKNWFNHDKRALLNHIVHINFVIHETRVAWAKADGQLRNLPKFCFGTDQERLALAKKRIRLAKVLDAHSMELGLLHRELLESTDLLMVL